jgi:hypothetical protein
VGVALQWGLEIALSRDRAGGGVEGGAVVSAGFIEGSGVGAREVSKSKLVSSLNCRGCDVQDGVGKFRCPSEGVSWISRFPSF